MKLNPSETSLVIAGAWNPAIVTPEWVIRHCTDLDPNNARVQAQVPAGLGLALDFPRFTIGDFAFTARPDALLIMPIRSDEPAMDLSESVARRTVEILSHTPVGGLGHNFEFVDEAPAPGVLGAFTAAQQDLVDVTPAGWNSRATSLGTSFEVGQTVVNVQRTFREGRLTVKFNFHYPVAGASACAAVIRREHGEQSMFQNLQLAKRLVMAIYGELNEED